MPIQTFHIRGLRVRNARSFPGIACATLFAGFVGSLLAGCASGGGGGAPATGSSVLCGTDELNARPCSGSTPARPVAPDPVVTSTNKERTALPLATAPVNRDAGAFDTIALQRTINWDSGAVLLAWPRDGALRIESDPATQTYTVLIDLPGRTRSDTFDLDDADFGYRIKTTTAYSDGQTSISEFDDEVIQGLQTGLQPADPTQATTGAVGYLILLHGTQNVSLGQWLVRDLAWDPERKAWDTSAYGCYDCFGLDDDHNETTRLFFAYGNRTNPADIPVSGRASFRLRGNNYERGSNLIAGNRNWEGDLIDDVLLSADFGRQRISATLDRPAELRRQQGAFGPYDVHYWGIRLQGESPFDREGRFSIPLAGALLTNDPAEARQSIPLTGQIEGAFFGPGAGEVGGAYAISAEKDFRYEGSFAGARE